MCVYYISMYGQLGDDHLHALVTDLCQPVIVLPAAQLM